MDFLCVRYAKRKTESNGMTIKTIDFELPFSDKRFKVYPYIETLLIVASSIFMLSFAGAISLWVDELWTYYFVVGDLFDLLQKKANDSAPPLYYLTVMPFAHFAPHTEFWLRFPSVVFTILSFFVIKKIAVEIGGRDVGFFTFLLAVTTSTMYTDAAWEARQYALYIFLSAVLFWLYILRIKTESNKNIILLGMLMVLCLHTHYFAVIHVAFFGITDLILWLRKKIRIRCIISYVIALFLCLPWYIYAFILNSSTRHLETFWARVPSNPILESGLQAHYLLGNPMSGLLFLLSAAGVIIVAALTYKKQSENTNEFNVLLFASLSVLWLYGFVYFYSRILNPNASLWVERYFLSLMPVAIILTVFGGFAFISFLLKRSWNDKVVAFLLVLFFSTNSIINFFWALETRSASSSPFREVAHAVATDPRAYETTSAVIFSTDPWFSTLFALYYFYDYGRRIPPNLYHGYSGLARTESHRLSLENTRTSMDALLQYDLLFVCNKFHGIDESLQVFIDAHFTKSSGYIFSNRTGWFRPVRLILGLEPTGRVEDELMIFIRNEAD